MSKLLPLLAAALALLLAAPAFAHSTLEKSIPADGATVSAPKTLELTFTKDLRLVTVRLVADGYDKALEVDRAAPAGTTFSLPLPSLEPAKYTVKWRASATDGHIMTGSFAFTVAGAAKSP